MRISRTRWGHDYHERWFHSIYTYYFQGIHVCSSIPNIVRKTNTHTHKKTLKCALFQSKRLKNRWIFQAFILVFYLKSHTNQSNMLFCFISKGGIWIIFVSRSVSMNVQHLTTRKIFYWVFSLGLLVVVNYQLEQYFVYFCGIE